MAVYTKRISQAGDAVWAYVARDGNEFNLEVFQFFSMERKFKRAHAWADKQIELAKKYEVNHG